MRRASSSKKAPARPAKGSSPQTKAVPGPPPRVPVAPGSSNAPASAATQPAREIKPPPAPVVPIAPALPPAGAADRDFPHFLKHRDEEEYRTEFGAVLKELRIEKSIEFSAVLEAVQQLHPEVDEALLYRIEDGDLGLPLGSLYDIVHSVYGVPFTDALGLLFKRVAKKKKDWLNRPFERDYYYSYVREARNGHKITPMLFGGDRTRFVWAVPLRRLKGQTMVTEFLELAPKRVDHTKNGSFPMHVHKGAEVIYVIAGTIMVHVFTQGKDGTLNEHKPILGKDDFIHFMAGQQHYIENNERTTKALMLVTRVLTP